MGKQIVYKGMPTKPRQAKCAWAQAQSQFGEVSSIHLKEVTEEGFIWVVEVFGVQHHMVVGS